MKPPYILIADDDSDDIQFLAELLQKEKPGIQLAIFSNGEELLQYLESIRSYNLPLLVVLDMNMPKMDGKQTIVALKKHQQFKNLPVVVYTSSDNKTDAMFCNKYSAHYMVKPWDIQHIQQAAKRIAGFCMDAPVN
jgi:CheY-like chemotaxis protein